MAEAAFEVKYDGPALADGRMPVRDLAPALLALGDVFAEASAVLHPDRDPVALHIKATAEGSFEVQLILEAAGMWDQVVDLLSSDAASALANLMQYIGGATGLFMTIRAIGRRVIKRQERTPAGLIKLTLEDGETLEIPAEVFDLYRNIRVRRKIREVVEPLDRPGVDRLELRRGRDMSVTIETGDVDAFEPPEDIEVPLLDRETEMVLAIASVAFIEGNKWRFSDGERTFYATIEDEAFLDRVERGLESFRKGDFLECRIRTVQAQHGESLHTEYYVTEVLRHIPRAVQLPLDASEEPPPKLPPETG